MEQIVIVLPAPHRFGGIIGHMSAVYLVQPDRSAILLKDVTSVDVHIDTRNLLTAKVRLSHVKGDRSGLWEETRFYEVAEVRTRDRESDTKTATVFQLPPRMRDRIHDRVRHTIRVVRLIWNSFPGVTS